MRSRTEKHTKAPRNTEVIVWRAVTKPARERVRFAAKLVFATLSLLAMYRVAQ